MLREQILNKKEYEDYIVEAVREIPLYCEEWTNFNPSDPGMTILENLTAFQTVQANYIEDMPVKLQGRIMEMAGFHTILQNPAKVLLKVKGDSEDIEFPANQPFQVGGVQFETNQGFIYRPNRIKEVFSKVNGENKMLYSVLRKDIPVQVEPFGEVPAPGNALYLVFEKELDTTRDFICYFEFDDCRKKFQEENEIIFSKVEWQVYTDHGFVPILVKDETNSMSHSGEVKFKWKNLKPALWREGQKEGHCIRCEIKEADYDIIPRLKNIYGFLFEVRQKETKSLCFTYSNKKEIRVKNHIIDEEYVQVFCKEEGDNFYHSYRPYRKGDAFGRYFEKEVTEDGTHVYRFDQDRFGHGPGVFPDAIKIVAYGEEMMRQFEIGTIYGYDNQEIQLPVRNILRDGFCLLVRRTFGNNNEKVDFVRPDRTGEDELGYTLDEATGKITIYNAGDYIGAKIHVGSICICQGEKGNILAGNQFIPKGRKYPVTFYNPVNGKGGRHKETAAERKMRFLTDMSLTGSLVLESDYVRTVKEIPNLLIDRVKAIVNEKNNSVRVVVKPGTREELPKLSFSYLKQIQEYLDHRRLLNTKIYVCQPDYLKVEVRGTIYINKNFTHYKQKIEEIIREYIDYVNGDKGFGETLEMDILYNKLDGLPCVSYVHNLHFVSMNRVLGKVIDKDLILQESVLTYPGDIDIEYIIDLQ